MKKAGFTGDNDSDRREDGLQSNPPNQYGLQINSDGQPNPIHGK
jgi:hypothetical protein